MQTYTEYYVKFFLHRNGIVKFDNIAAIEQNTFSDPRLSEIISELQDWPGYAITNHKNAGHPLHKLSFIAELGFRSEKSPVTIHERRYPPDRTSSDGSLKKSLLFLINS